MKKKFSMAILLAILLTMTLSSLASAAVPAHVEFTTDAPCAVTVLVTSYTDPANQPASASGSTPWTLDVYPSTSVTFFYPASVVCNGTTYNFVSATPGSPLVAGADDVTTMVIGHYGVDTTPPTLQLPANMTVEAESASGAVVTFSATATDTNPANPPVTCNPASGSTFPLDVTTTVSCSATDASGNTANGSFTITVQDTTRPTLALPADITVNASNASGQIVNFTATATDLVDGSVPVTCVPASGSTFPVGTTDVACSATDSHGNTATGSFTVTVIMTETTPPVWDVPADFSVEATGPAGAVVTYVASASDHDGDGPVTSQSCSPASGSTFPLGTTTVDCTAIDIHGKTSTASFNVTVVDTGLPTITFLSRLPAANSYGWNKTDVTVTWSCSDTVGVLSPTVTQVVSSEGFSLSATGTCTDTSGNTASDTQIGINIDKTAPTLSPSVSPLPVVLRSNSSRYTVSAGAHDALSGINTQGCTGTVDTSTVGSKTIPCTATDKAGNANSAFATYSVQYAASGTLCKGIPGHQVLQPIHSDGSSVFKQGSTIPVRFRLCGADGVSIGTPGVVTGFRLMNSDLAVLSTSSNDTFHFGNQQWIFNLSTKNLTAGTTYVYLISLNDGSSIQFKFNLK